MSVTTLPFLHIANLKKSVQTFEFNISILEDVNLQVKQGDTVAIVGASGTGKTTLLSLIAGVDTPTAGQVYLKNNPMFELSEDQRATVRQRLIGFVFQSFLLLPSLTAIENVMLPLEIQNYSYDECYQRAYETLKQVGL
jgi:putative ABC transport system ATP-binding protein